MRRNIEEHTTEEQTLGGGEKGIGTWILGSQLNWFRLIPLQEFICPLLDLIPCSII
jgi:hypothetical protein